MEVEISFPPISDPNSAPNDAQLESNEPKSINPKMSKDPILDPSPNDESNPPNCEVETQTLVEDWMKEVPLDNDVALPTPNPDLVWAMVDGDLDEFICKLVNEV